MEDARYIVGIDLGTTNCALAYVDTGAGDDDAKKVQILPLPQLVNPGEVREQDLLPSFNYLPGAHELPAGSLKLPWCGDRKYSVGVLARQLGEQIPRRLVASAKSWLGYGEVDRKSPILPWEAETDLEKISPFEATTRYLVHLKEAWNHCVAGEVAAHRLETQDVLLTVPASFDAVARELTVQAAAAAGLERVTLLEEPQAAFYAWLDRQGDQWRTNVKLGDVILVCDIGGGTTDFTLIAVGEEAGNLTLERLAVGDHILLGGDNMDLALAHFVKRKLESDGRRLDWGQLRALSHTCRTAKERILADPAAGPQPIVLLGGGSRLIGGALKTELLPAEALGVVLDGFFPMVPVKDRPAPRRTAGLHEIGLPFASDPAVPKHVAQFLADNLELRSKPKKKQTFLHPTAILFNGGVMKARAIHDRVLEILNGWLRPEGSEPVRVLESQNLDLAVARGAAYYGLARRGKGIRIRGGAPRTYYVAVETAMPAVPGMAPPTKALCVVPFGTEEGSEFDIPAQEFNLIVGAPVEFRFLSSTHRKQDGVGDLVEDWESKQIEELAPLQTVLTAEGQKGSVLPVRLCGKVTEVGTLELWCVGRNDTGRWKLEFNVRDRANG